MFQHTDGQVLVQLYIALVKELVREYVELIQNKYEEPTEDAIDLQSALTMKWDIVNYLNLKQNSLKKPKFVYIINVS